MGSLGYRSNLCQFFPSDQKPHKMMKLALLVRLVATRKQTDMNVNPGEHERLLLQI